ncbi:hypothetical protein [Vagococcus bubulae]|uniref:Uncharacterized protein n=1 Tax=Vagococcus bubulae TaxID=1977868 RepID=A0A429ZDH6_9ENTE|nr:hypothetical protein [Vagococcus bubulae]RST91742.1 hypothetical protein CBF36_09630 [Vagococcus bubulae]
MSLEDLVIDVQLYQEETKQPNSNSVILLTNQNIAMKKNQLLLKWSNRRARISEQTIKQAVGIFLSKWKQNFYLYPVERVFLDYSAHERIELLITFEASRLYSNTQIRNIKTTAPNLFKLAITEAQEQFGDATRAQYNQSMQPGLMGYDDNKFSMGTHAQKPMSSSQVSSRFDDDLFGKDQKIYSLEQQLNENSRVIKSFEQEIKSVRQEYEQKIEQVVIENDDLKQRIISYQDNEIDYRQQLQLNQSEILSLKNNVTELNFELENEANNWQEKLKAIQTENEELRLVINENQQFEEQVQRSLDESNQKLKEKENQLIRLEQESNMLTKEWQMKYQQISIENERLKEQQLRLEDLLSERQDMIQVLNDELTQKELAIQEIAQENQRIAQRMQEELTRREMDFNNLNRTKNEEIQKLSTRLEKQQDLVNQLMDSQETSQVKWQDNYNRLEKNYRMAADRVFDLEKELKELQNNSYAGHSLDPRSRMNDFSYPSSQQNSFNNTNDNFGRYSDDAMFKDDNSQLFANNDIPVNNTVLPTSDELMANEFDKPSQEDIHNDVEDFKKEDYPADDYESDDYEYYEDDLSDDYEYYEDYEDDESDDYEYYEDYEDYTDEDNDLSDDYEEYDYEEYRYYNEKDDTLGYDSVTIMNDVDSILYETQYEEGKEKIRKKEYEVFEEQLDLLPDRWKALKSQDMKFKKWAKPKMKKFDRFYRNLEEDIRPPKFLSRKYVMTEEVWGEVQAYALISRHLQTILDYEE